MFILIQSKINATYSHKGKIERSNIMLNSFVRKSTAFSPGLIVELELKPAMEVKQTRAPADDLLETGDENILSRLYTI